MKETILTKAEAVAKYGSDDCKNHFLKYRKFTNKKIENALIKTLEQYYISVDIVKQGRANVYRLGEERKEKVERKRNLGGNISNGAWKIAYTKNLDIIVVSHLENKKVITGAQTLNKWCLDFGLISNEMYHLVMSKYNDTAKKNHVKKLKQNNIIKEGQERIIDDYIETFQNLQGQLVSALNRMQKLNIIEYYPVIKAVLKNGETINLHEITYQELLSKKRELMKKYDVDEWYLNTYKNSKKSINYMVEWAEVLDNIKDLGGNVLKLDYYYTAYAIMLKATEKKIINYLRTYNKDVIQAFESNQTSFLNNNELFFHDKRKDFIYEKAEVKTDNFLNGTVPPKKVRDLQKELGGKLKRFYHPRIEDFTYDEDYYRLFFEGLYAQKIKELQEHYNVNFIKNL
jgi:hypothetical protein